MLITVKRNHYKNNYTIGDLFIGETYLCNTLELPYTDGLKGSAIPCGEYEVTLYKSPKFGRELPMITNVPNRSYILFHAGNTVADTDGCILVGVNRVKGEVHHSRHYEDIIVVEIKKAIAKGEKVIVKIQ